MREVESLYWKTDRIIAQEMDKLEINLDHSNKNESDMETDSDDNA